MAAWCDKCELEVSKKNWAMHVASKKHTAKVTQERVAAQRRMKNQGCGVFVSATGRPLPSVDLLAQHFRRFGPLAGVLAPQSTASKAVVQFQTRHAAQTALRASHQLGYVNLKVTPRRDHLKDEKPPEPSNQEELDKLLSGMEGELASLTMDDQIMTLMAKMASGDAEEARREAICASLEQWLAVQFPGCRIQPFGSVVSGLASRTSDLDLYVSLPPAYANMLGTAPNGQLAVLEAVSSVLRSHPDINRLFVVRQARIPVTKFVHSGVNCDLSSINALGLRNSQLLRHLQTLDGRVRPLFFFLKSWSRTHRFKELGLSSYALILMAVFFLQQEELAVLPSIEWLQAQVPTDQHIFINGWNVSFPHSASHQPTGRSGAGVFDLAERFFEFYAALDASDRVLCPLTGRALPKSSFAAEGCAEAPLPPCMRRLTEAADGKAFNAGGALCVQDPFELNFNVTANFRHWPALRDRCRDAADLCRSMSGGHSARRLASLLGPAPDAAGVVQLVAALTAAAPVSVDDQRAALHLIAQSVRHLFDYSFFMLDNDDAAAADQSSPSKRPRLDFSGAESVPPDAESSTPDPAADCAIGSRPPPSASGDSEAEASVPPSAAVAGSDPEAAVAGEEPTWMTLRVPFELWNERSSVDETLPKESSMSFADRQRAVTLRLATRRGASLSDRRADRPFAVCRAAVAAVPAPKKKKRPRGAQLRVGLTLRNGDGADANRRHFGLFVDGLRRHWPLIVEAVVREKRLPYAAVAAAA